MSSREFHSLTEAFGPCSSFKKANLSLLENISMEEPCGYYKRMVSRVSSQVFYSEPWQQEKEAAVFNAKPY